VVPLQEGVELEPGEAEVSGRPRLVAVGALEGFENGRPLEVLQGAGVRLRSHKQGEDSNEKGRGAAPGTPSLSAASAGGRAWPHRARA